MSVSSEEASLDPLRVMFLPGTQETSLLWREVIGRLDLPSDIVEMVEVLKGRSMEAAARELLNRYAGELVVVGHSLGGTLAMVMARLAPDRVVGMALVAASPLPPTAAQRRSWRRMLADTRLGRYENLVDVLGRQLATGAGQEGLRVRGIVRSMAHDVGPSVFQDQMLMQQSRCDERFGLRRFSGPALVLAGSRDRLVKPSTSEDLAALLRAQFLVHPTSGHLIPLECPGWLAERLNSWLTETGLLKPGRFASGAPTPGTG